MMPLREGIGLAQVNARSLLTNFDIFKNHVLDSDYDVVGVTETWLTPAISSDVVAIANYSLLRNDREGRGGGVALYIKNIFRYERVDIDNNIEEIWIKIYISNIILCVGTVYRPPRQNFFEFSDHFETSLSLLVPSSNEIVCMGDFNIDLLNDSSRMASAFMSLVSDYCLEQVITQPTRITQSSSTLLDIILLSNSELVSASGVFDLHGVSDHSLVYCNLQISRPCSPVYRTYRDFRFFNYQHFNDHLRAIPWRVIFDFNNVDDKVHFLNTSIIELLDLHAPFVTSRLTRAWTPWVTEDIKFQISLRDKALRKFKRTKDPLDWGTYKALRNHVTGRIRQQKRVYLHSSFGNHSMPKFWKDLKRMNIFGGNNKTIPPSYPILMLSTAIL